MPTDTQVNDLKINVLSEAQYEQIQSPSATELYLVPETVDTTPTSGSTNPITSGGVYNALQNIPSQEQSDWSETDTTDPAFIKNKPQNIVTDAGYVHTDNNYTTTEKSKLAGIEAGAEANVQSDWNQTNSSADDFIKNKPDLDATLYEEVTYSQLRTKIDNEQLVEGKKYRITDYVTLLDSGDNPSVSSSYKYKSAQHPFDLVVTATSASTLDCCAQAVLHDGDTYFDAEKLSKLKIWYSVIGNDVEYAHPYNGKGCIYRMVDEFGNDCPYDFHNVMFKRKVNNGVYDEQSGTLTWLYTFDSGFGADVSFNAQFGNNVIKPYIVDDEGGNKNKLMAGTVFFGGGWYNNTIGFRCYEVTIGDTCSSNNIGNDCNDIVLISSSDNVIGAYVTASRISNLQKSAIGPSCGNLNIGSASSQTYFYNIIVAGGNNSLSLAGDGNGSVYYVYVEQGVSGTVTLAGGLSYGMRVGKQSDGSIRIYNEDDQQVQANWNESNSSSPSYIQHKPNLATVATSGSYNDLTNKPTLFSGNYNDLTNKPTIPAAQVNSDWNATSGVAQILNKPDFTVDTEISETSINPVQNKAISIYTKMLWNNYDIRIKCGTEYISHPNYIAPGTGNWVITENEHYAIPIKGIRHVTLIANSSRPGRYTFLKTYTVGETGTPDYATGYSTAIAFEVNTTVSVDVPSDANYLYFYARDNDSSTPAHIYCTGVGITDKLDDLSDFPSINGNNGKVLAVNSGETGVEWVNQSGGGGTEEVLVCNYDISNHTMDKTITDIYNAYTAGKIIVCKSNTTVYYLETCVDVSCRFHAVQNTGQLLSFKYIKYLNGTWSEGQDDWNSKQDKLIGTQTTGQNIKTVNGNSLLGSGDLIIGGVTIYSGSTTPSSSTGSDGDIYIQTAS